MRNDVGKVVVSAEALVFVVKVVVYAETVIFNCGIQGRQILLKIFFTFVAWKMHF